MSFFREYDVPGWGKVCEFDAFTMPDMLRNVPVDVQDVADVRGVTLPSYQSDVRDRWATRHVAETMEKAEALFTRGWPQGGDLLRNLAEGIRPYLPQPKDLRRLLAYRDSGDELVPERLYSGRMDSMWRTRKRKYAISDSTITIASHYCTVSVNPEFAILSGGVAVALAYLLEQYGYRVEVLGILTVNPHGDDYRYQRHPKTQVCIAHLKSPHQTLQLDYLAAALHPYSVYLYAKRMVTELTLNSPYKGFPHSLKCNDSARVFVTDWMQHGGRRVDFASDYVGSPSKMQHEAIQAVAQLGGHFEGLPAGECCDHT